MAYFKLNNIKSLHFVNFYNCKISTIIINFSINIPYGGIDMKCRVTDLRCKDVICRVDGVRLGCVDDVEVDVKTAQLVSIIIFGRLKCFGLLGRCDDIVIGWENIALIGEDTILVDFRCERPRRKRHKFGFKIF